MVNKTADHETAALYRQKSNDRRLLLIGGGGHCHSVLDSILSLEMFSRIGIVDSEKLSPVLGISVIGTDEDLPQLINDGWTDAFITVGSVGNTAVRNRLYQRIKKIGYHIPVIVDPSAAVAGSADLSEGTYVGKKAVVNTGSQIGCCAIINTGAIVEHDCIIGDFAHISPGAVLCGQVSVGNDSHIGTGSTVIQQIKIGRNSLIGAGSVVIRDIPDNVKAYGNPCRVVL